MQKIKIYLIYLEKLLSEKLVLEGKKELSLRYLDYLITRILDAEINKVSLKTLLKQDIAVSIEIQSISFTNPVKNLQVPF